MKKFTVYFFILLGIMSGHAFAQSISTDKTSYKPKEKVIISYSYEGTKGFNLVFVFVTPITGNASFSSNAYGPPNSGKKEIDDGRFGPGEYEVVLMDQPSGLRTILAKTKFTVVGPCKKGEKINCNIKWETLKCVPVNSSAHPVTSTSAYTNILKNAVDILNSKGLTPSSLAFGGTATTGLAAWFREKVKEAYKDPKKVAGEAWTKILNAAVTIPEVGIAAGMLPALAFTAASALVDVELLESVIRKMVNLKYGVQLTVDVEYDECVSHFFGDNTLEKRSVSAVKFGPANPAGPEALTAMTFSPIAIDDLLKLPLLKNAETRLDVLSRNTEEMNKAGVTPKDVDDRLKTIRAEIAAAEGRVAEFKELHRLKICDAAMKTR